MARVLPSDVVELIDKLFPEAATQVEGKEFSLSSGHGPLLGVVVDLVERVPDELIVLDSQQYIELISSVVIIRARIRIWESKGETMPLYRIHGLRDLNPVALIRQALAACPDRFPSPRTTELKFIRDRKRRQNLREDVTAIERAVSNAEWKVATVLAGSVIEALLLWKLQKLPKINVLAAAKKLATSGAFKDPGKQLERWSLHHYIEVAAEFKNILEQGTITLCRLVKDYRNLIHPGLAVRSGQVCDRGAAYAAVAALQHVVRDLG